VKEGALEVLVPVLADLDWVRALDVSAAVRATDYSVAGFETTWKLGASYQMTDELRFRLTQSRDIRAPNLQDLFSPPIGNNNTTPDPFRGNVSSQYRQITRGNTSLTSERADTTGIGLVYQPEWVEGFSMSIDYYKIKNNGAVASPSFAYVLQQCFVGVQAYCTQVTRHPVPAGSLPGTIGALQSIATGPQNQASVLAKGIDYELSYRTTLSDWVDSWDGNLAIRVVATNVMDRITDSGIAGPTQFLNAAGVASSPRWGVNTQVTYSLDRFRLTFINRYLSRSLQSNTLLACSTNCPTISGFQTVDVNSLPSYFLSNLTATYRFYEDGENNAEAFFNVDNLFDKDPPVAPNQIAGATYGLATLPHFDTLGRRFRLGIRFQM
jgi:iron complex outermembrane recepter protein